MVKVSNNLIYNTIQTQSYDVQSKIDLNIDGYIKNSKSSFVLYNSNAVVNQVKLWLLSKPDDLLREDISTQYKNSLYDLIGMRMTDNELLQKANLFKDEFNTRGYSSDLTLTYLNLIPDYINRTIKVDFIVKSNTTELLYRGSATVSE